MKKRTADTAKIVSEHRADPGAATRGLTQLLLCGVSLAVPIAEHTADPAWRALVADLERMLERLDTMATATTARAAA